MPLAAVLHGAHDLRVEEIEDRPLAAGKIRVRFGGGGICGSDLHYFLHGRTGSFEVVEPLILGHEVSGEIVELGGAGSDLRLGQRVAVNPSRPCGGCPRCHEARLNLCSDIFFMGSASKRPHMQGGFVEIIDVEPGRCFAIPERVPIEHAALAEPLSVCLHAANRAGEIAGRSVLVIGAGPIGLLQAAVARLRGAARIAVCDLEPSALARAEAMGAHEALPAGEAPPVEAYDLVFEASGSPKGLAAAIGAARRGGTLVQVGNLPAGDLPLPAAAITAKELTLKGTFRFSGEYAEAVALIVAGRIPLEPIITGRYPLSRAGEALEIASDRGLSSKVVLLEG